MKQYEQKYLDGYHDRILVTQDFIDKNNLKLCRTQREIVKKIEELDGFRFDGDVYINYLTFKNAKEFLSNESVSEYIASPDKWPLITNVAESTQDFLDYMVFAWMKALDERGISASCSIDKLGAWLWLMGRDDLYEIIRDPELYNPYGSPALIKVCEAMGITAPDGLYEFSKHKCH